MYTFISNSEEETIKFAKSLAHELKQDEVIILKGDLGAGKTKFVQGILEYFKLENEISSPTFTIVNEYKNDEVEIFHFDLYRLNDIDEFYAIGGEEYFKRGLCIFEWGEMIETILPKYKKITINKGENDINKRIINIEQF